MSSSDSILEAAIGLASINSLIEVDTERCVELNGGDLLIEKGKGKKVAIVGQSFSLISLGASQAN
jgi:uncharacterized protein (DUF4213/DUF364 family)